MLYTAKLISDNFEGDDDHRGMIQVLFEQQIQWARPNMAFGSFCVPTKEWIQKYAANDAIDVFVSFLNNEKYLVYTGFTVYQNKLPADAMKNYSYRRINFTENWETWTDDTDQNNTYVVQHSDGTIITIDRTTGKENIKIYDPKLKNTILLDKTGIKINGDYVLLKGFLDIITNNQAFIGLDSLGGPVQLSPTVVSQIQEALQESDKIISKKV